MRKRSQRGYMKNEEDKKLRGLSKERKLLQSRKKKNERTEMGEEMKETKYSEKNEGNAQNSFFERHIFHAFAFKQCSENIFCLSN